MGFSSPWDRFFIIFMGFFFVLGRGISFCIWDFSWPWERFLAVNEVSPDLGRGIFFCLWDLSGLWERDFFLFMGFLLT